MGAEIWVSVQDDIGHSRDSRGLLGLFCQACGPRHGSWPHQGGADRWRKAHELEREIVKKIMTPAGREAPASFLNCQAFWCKYVSVM